jgi:hypothetical protein
VLTGYVRIGLLLASDERDEAGTLAALKALRAEVFEPRTRAHGRRIFKIAGDGALCEFASAVDAVRAALEVQRARAERNVGLPEERCVTAAMAQPLDDVLVNADPVVYPASSDRRYRDIRRSRRHIESENEKEPITIGEARLSRSGSAQHGRLMAQQQDLDLQPRPRQEE